MVPIRVELQGFLSYRERAVLSFDSSPLWMLSGPNGAGKSSIFDAITFALYGLHRGGLQQHAELINHNSDALLVEFDFSLGDEIYRVKRTHSRRARGSSGSAQAFRLQDGVPVPIPETDLREGFKKWLDATVGLDAAAFTTSVLLQQNKSDALLAADARERHAILSQIVDMAAYQKLHEEVRGQYTLLQGRAKALETQLENSERIDPQEIARLEDEVARTRAESQLRVEKMQELAAVKVHAHTWEKNAREKSALEGELEGVRGLIARAAEISERHARWSDFKIHLPQLERALTLREEAEQATGKYLAAQEQAQSWATRHDHAQAEFETQRAEAIRLREEVKSWRERGHAARETLESLAPTLRELEELERLEAEAAGVQTKLRAFAPNFEEEVESTHAELSELNEIAAAIPVLKQFAAARASWNEMKARMEQERKNKERLEADAVLAQEQAPAAREAAQAADDKWQAAREDESRVRALLKTERERARKLVSSDIADADGAACDFCGAPLDAEHLEDERDRREQAVRELMAELAEAEATVARAREKRDSRKVEAERAEANLARLALEAQTAEREINLLKSEGRILCGQAEHIIAGLPPAFAAHYESEPARVSEHFKNPFPSTDELRVLDNRASKKPTVEKQAQVLVKRERERAHLLTQQSDVLEKLGPLSDKYSPAARERLRAESAGAKAAASMARAREHELEAALAESESKRDDAQKLAQSATSGQSEARATTERERALQEAKTSEHDSLLANLEGDWKVLVQSATRDDATRLQADFRGLAGAEQEMLALNAARDGLAAQIARDRELEQVLAATPTEYQREEADVEAEAARVRGERARLDATASDLEAEKQDLQARAARRNELIEEQKRLSKQANVHKTLSDLLGPNALQRHLLQQAESLIVENANRLLDTMSGGVLQLQLKAGDDTPSSGSANGKVATQKALELLATNQATGGRPMPVEFLSGSQKFRVAVALALGIGQFASSGGSGDSRDGHQGSRRIESVIIDEGFGSLDQDGRENIVNELRELRSILKRVIVVSHQEELARAFPSRYEITLQDGTSTARIIEAEG
jgi:DNA repair exonuclease SbcCD ATPase subunit